MRNPVDEIQIHYLSLTPNGESFRKKIIQQLISNINNPENFKKYLDFIKIAVSGGESINVSKIIGKQDTYFRNDLSDDQKKAFYREYLSCLKEIDFTQLEQNKDSFDIVKTDVRNELLKLLKLNPATNKVDETNADKLIKKISNSGKLRDEFNAIKNSIISDLNEANKPKQSILQEDIEKMLESLENIGKKIDRLEDSLNSPRNNGSLIGDLPLIKERERAEHEAREREAREREEKEKADKTALENILKKLEQGTRERERAEQEAEQKAIEEFLIDFASRNKEGIVLAAMRNILNRNVGTVSVATQTDEDRTPNTTVSDARAEGTERAIQRN